MAERPVETAKQDQMTKTFTVLALLGLALAAGAAFFGLPGPQSSRRKRSSVPMSAAMRRRVVVWSRSRLTRAMASPAARCGRTARPFNNLAFFAALRHSAAQADPYVFHRICVPQGRTCKSHGFGMFLKLFSIGSAAAISSVATFLALQTVGYANSGTTTGTEQANEFGQSCWCSHAD